MPARTGLAMTGDCVLMIAGQSNGIQMCTVPVAGCAPVADTYVWQGAWRAMTPADGAGMITIANTLRQNGHDSVYVYNCCYGGSSVVPDAAITAENCWKVGAPPLTDCMAQVAAGGKVPQFVVWIQGEQEVDWGATHPALDMVRNYELYLGQLRLYLLGQWRVASAQCAWMVTPVGVWTGRDSYAVRLSQAQYCEATAGAFLGPSRADLALLDVVHLSGPSCRTFGDRIAAAILSYVPEDEVMTDPQDKAAIANLQMAVADLQSSINLLLASGGSLQQSIGAIQGRIGALEALHPPQLEGLPGVYTLDQLDPFGDLATLPFSFDSSPTP